MKTSKSLCSTLISLGLLFLSSFSTLAQSNALQFDGANDYVTFGTATSLGSSTFTIETWFKQTGSGVATTTGSGGITTAIPLVTKGRGEADGSNVDMNWFMGLSGGKLCADFEAFSNGQNYPVTGVRLISQNEWHHAAVTYDGTTLRLYLDGVLDNSLLVGVAPRYDSIQHAALATALTSTGSPIGYFAGSLDEVRIWNYSRSGEEITSSMYNTIPSAPGMLARWSLDEGSGTTAGDTAGNNVTGTLINGPTWVQGAPMTPIPTCILISPTDQNVVVTPQVTFTCQVQDVVGLASVSLYVGLSGQALELMETQIVTGKTATVSFNTILQNGQSYEWNCLVANTASQQNWASNNYQLLVDGNYPDIPMLLAPANGASSMPTTVTLQAQVSDPNNDPLTVTFYAWKPQAEFTLAVLPDTQNYSQSYPNIFTTQTSWIASNATTRNIVFVAHEGDLVNSYSDLAQYSRANASMSLLDGVVPYGLTTGNHDIPSANFNTTFPYTRYEGQPWYGGHYGSNNDNNYQLFSAGGLDFIVIHLGHHPSTDVITWADGVLKTYPNRKAIIVTHAFLNLAGARFDTDFNYSTEYIWQGLVVPNNNVYFVLCGHDSGEVARTDDVNGRKVHQILADYQSRTNGGSGWMRLMRFAPTENRVYVQTYSPYVGQYERDADSEFALDFPMRQFEVLATQPGLPSGAIAQAVWTNLNHEASYEWFVEAADSTGRSTLSPIWRFTTGAETTPPVISGVTVADITSDSARITWSTDKSAESQIDYGVTTGLGNTSATTTMTTSHSIALTQLIPETVYYYRVISRDASGNVGSSEIRSFTTSADAPKPYDAYVVQNPTLTPGTLGGNGIAGTTTAGDSLNQTVTEATDAVGASMSAEYLLHTSANPTKILAFTLYFSGSWTSLDANDSLRIQIWNKGLNNGQGGWENITADLADGIFTPANTPQNYVNSLGNIVVLFQDSGSIRREKKDKLTVDLLMARVIAGTLDTVPPSAPTNLSGNANNLSVNLSWMAPGDADVSGYKIYRSTQPSSGYGLVSSGLITVTTFTDTTPSAGAYYYIVTAVDISGNESIASNPAAVTTTQPPANAIHVETLSLTVAKSSTKYVATATVRVNDQTNTLITGATVTGDWYLKGVIIQTGATGTTGADGTTKITSAARTAKSGDVFRFVVTGISRTGCIYDPAANAITEGTIAVP